MEDAPNDAETSGKRAKRNRKASGNGGGSNERTSDASEDQVKVEVEREEFRLGAKRNRASVTTTPAPQNSNQSLIDIIKGNQKNIPQLVKIWVERYEKGPKAAMVELLTMLFQACGAKCRIKKEGLDADVIDVVLDLVYLFIEGEVEDYQTSKKANLVFFWEKLVVECQKGPLFDNELFDKCMEYMIELSRTPPRVYRQVATMMGLQLVTSFITVAKALGAQRETTQRWLNAEKKKRAEGPLLESLNKRLSMTLDKILVLETMMLKIFTELPAHRYLDIDPTVRISCIASLGEWILSYPSLFLQELYLKYLGWALNDKHAGVRKASVLALLNLYDKASVLALQNPHDVDDNVSSLSIFSEQFSNRMIELADDIDVSVAVSAIALVKQLLRHHFIRDDVLAPLYNLLVDDPAEIRHAIGELVYDRLITQKINTTQSSSKGNDNESEVHLSRMLHILREFSADPIVSVYVIDGIWDHMKAMKDWKCIVSKLLDENPLTKLTDNDATNLVRLLFASARKAVGERIVPASDNRRPHYSKAQKEIIEKNRRHLTIAMMKNLPLLLRKFMKDKTKVPSLVEVTLYMNIKHNSLKNFKNVLHLIKEAFFMHVDKEPLRSCVKAIKFFSIESQGEWKDYALKELKNLEDHLISKVQSAMKAAGDGDVDSLHVCLKRLYELQLSGAVPIDNLYEDIVKALHIFSGVMDEVVSLLLLNMYRHVAWSLQSIVNSETVSEASVSSLILKRNTLFVELGHFLGTPSNAELARRVCIILAEAWCLFRKMNFSTKLERLGYCPGTSDLQRFWKLCEQQLKISDEDNDTEYIEETNRDAVIIAAAKLVATDTVSKEYLSPEIISHFVMHGTSITENVKHFITVIKKKDDDDVSIIFLEALKKAYQRHLIDLSINDDESITGKSFQECKDLAARLSGTFAGAARSKCIKEISKLVEDGIEYAFLDAPKQLSFLEGVVSHFISKLPTPKVLEILQDVKGRTESVDTDKDPSGWRPYHRFVAKNEALAEGKRLFDEQFK